MLKRVIPTFEDIQTSLWKYINDVGEEVVRQAYNRVVSILDDFTPQDSPEKDVDVYLGVFQDTGGRQLIAEGSVSDRKRPVLNQYNWHLQNTSQWLFACGLVYDKERKDFSLHT